MGQAAREERRLILKHVFLIVLLVLTAEHSYQSAWRIIPRSIKCASGTSSMLRLIDRGGIATVYSYYSYMQVAMGYLVFEADDESKPAV